MRGVFVVMAFLVAGCTSGAGHGFDDAVEATSFDAHDAGGPPEGFTVQGGNWQVQESLSARSAPQVLYQGRGVSGYAYAVGDAQVPADVAVEASVRITGGVQEREAGLLLRWDGPGDHYAFNIDANEGGVRFTRVADGIRDDLVLDRTVQYQMYGWYRLRVEAVGPAFTAYVDGQEVLHVEDATHPDGRAGLFTKQDALASFDDFAVLT